MSTLKLFVSCPPGVAELLLDELQPLGAQHARTLGAGVQCQGDLETAYRICLWSRLATRVLVELGRFEARDSDSLYAGVRTLDWPGVFDLEATFAVRATLQTEAFAHSGFVAQRVKDAVVDDFRAACGARPSVDKAEPDIRLHLHLRGHRATLALDLAGHSLHRRGYRGDEQVTAPLKENLAAAILRFAGWPAADPASALLDPMCGSGTLLLEGAGMAAGLAPGLARTRFGFHAWRRHQPALWARLREQAERARSAPPPAFGYDVDSRALALAAESAARAGLDGAIGFARRSLHELQPPPGRDRGLLITNPPYGERLRDADLPGLYHRLGLMLRRFGGWRAAVFTGNAELMFRVRREVRRKHALFNGALPCVLFDFGTLDGSGAVREDPGAVPAGAPPARAASLARARTTGGEALANRLQKNLRQLRRWRNRERISCFRAYDADIPEYAFALDCYDGAQFDLYLQEYAPPATVDAARARERSAELRAVVAEVFAAQSPRLHCRVRERQRGAGQYRPLDVSRHFDVVEEAGLRFYVNFSDYLDTGLFLDHRLTRARIRDLAGGADFLNLFAYTGTATVYAAAGGAASTTSVDLNRTYLDWAGDNLRLNDLHHARHALVRADCLQWLQQAVREERRWDLMFLDPPSFSNSSAMRETLDIQRDHARLIREAARLLRPGGVLLFASNRRRLRLDPALSGEFVLRDLTGETTSPDFARRPGHRCWEIRDPGGEGPGQAGRV